MIGHEQRVLAIRYAQAFLYVHEKLLSKDICHALDLVMSYYKVKPSLLFYLEMPLFTQEEKKEALAMVRKFYKLPDFFEKLDLLLLDHARIFLLPLVYAELIRQSYVLAGYIPCTVTTATFLSEKEQQVCIQLVAQISKKIPLITWYQDPLLIAGIKFQTESWVWEDSLDARLRDLANTLLI